jgi:hypothetical protein
MKRERKCKWWKKGGKGNMRNYRFILPVRVSHFRPTRRPSPYPKIYITGATGELIIVGVAFLTHKKNRRKILGCAGLLIGCHSILRPSVS